MQVVVWWGLNVANEGQFAVVGVQLDGNGTNQGKMLMAFSLTKRNEKQQQLLTRKKC